jgi:maltose alpha-D-glucosyltransferase/alpha-amylase
MKPSLKEVLANMGKRSAEMHIGLSSPGISFGSEALSASRVSSIISSAHQQFDKVNKMVQSGAHRQDFIASGLPQLAGLMTFLRSIIDEYGQDLLEYPSIRIHGDYHLGQVLVDKQDVWILDFEGEPSKSLDDRRAHYPAVRDVAGMLRSFSYACHAAYFRISQPTQALSESLSALENAYIQIFLESYLKTTGENPVLYPAAFRRVLRFFLLDKALYELDYEWNNRPEWLRIPIAGLLQLYATVHVNPR